MWPVDVESVSVGGYGQEQGWMLINCNNTFTLPGRGTPFGFPFPLDKLKQRAVQ